MTTLSDNDILDIKNILDIAYDRGYSIKLSDCVHCYRTREELIGNPAGSRVARIVIIRGNFLKQADDKKMFIKSCQDILNRLSEFDFVNAEYSDGFYNYPCLHFTKDLLKPWQVPIYNLFPKAIEYVHSLYVKLTMNGSINSLSTCIRLDSKSFLKLYMIMQNNYKGSMSFYEGWVSHRINV